jgi:hypothetical protein
MKLLLFGFMIISAAVCAQQRQTVPTQSTDAQKIDSVFAYNFSLLDSFMKNEETETGHATNQAMIFMEKITGIKSDGIMTYVGKLTFSKENLVAWHKWYEENMNRLRWSKTERKVYLSKK